MNSTFILYEGRVNEIEFYYSIMVEIDNNSENIKTIDNRRFLRVLKSNFLLMLYNLVEACIVSGMMEIYESLRNNNPSYSSLIDEIRILWSNYEISKIYDSSAGKTSYEKRVQDVIEQVITNQPIMLYKETLGISGNLDARVIRKICDKHRIRYVASDDNGYLKIVKDKRNDLAHGDVSFGDCARDMTLNDLEHIKDEVTNFIQGILVGMKLYFDSNGFLVSTPSNSI